jgi:hypothetical protein
MCAIYCVFLVVDEDRSCSISATVGSSLFIASAPSNQHSDHSSRCGSRTSPWIVEAQTGQQISVRMLDFGQHQLQQQRQTDDSSNSQNPAVERSGNCSWHYGYIKDKAAIVASSKNVTLCAAGPGMNRDRFIYSSKGSTIEVVMALPQDGSDKTRHKFLLGFQGFQILPVHN